MSIKYCYCSLKIGLEITNPGSYFHTNLYSKAFLISYMLHTYILYYDIKLKQKYNYIIISIQSVSDHNENIQNTIQIRSIKITITTYNTTTTTVWFQRLPPARGGTVQRKIFHLANSFIQDRQVDLVFFMEWSQLYAATVTHYSIEPLTTGPDYDPLLLLLALAGDVHPNTGPSRYPCSVCFKNVTSQGTSYLCTRCSHWIHSRCSGLRNASDYHKSNGWICMTPP